MEFRIHLMLLTHLLSLRPAADLQALTFADGHLEAEWDPNVAEVLHPSVEGEALHAAYVLAAESTWRVSGVTPI